MRKVYQKTCPQCNKVFMTRYYRQICCSTSCHISRKNISSKASEIIKACPICAKNFVVLDNVHGRNKKTCSTKCGRALSSIKLAKQEIIKTCPTCNSTFSQNNSRQKYCCQSCNIKHRWRRGDFDGLFSLDKNAAWKGGLSFLPYNKDFSQKIKEYIKKRDNFTCKLCENSNSTLDVHHIDYDKNNSNSSNLISLCKSCHSKTNFKRKYYKQLLTKILNETLIERSHSVF